MGQPSYAGFFTVKHLQTGEEFKGDPFFGIEDEMIAREYRLSQLTGQLLLTIDKKNILLGAGIIANSLISFEYKPTSVYTTLKCDDVLFDNEKLHIDEYKDVGDVFTYDTGNRLLLGIRYIHFKVVNIDERDTERSTQILTIQSV